MTPEGRQLLVASTGGHLTQLVRMSARWQLSDDSVWVTFDSAQSRSLLEGRNVIFVPYVEPRGIKNAARAWSILRKALKGQRFDGVVSTGAAVALAAFLIPSLRGTPKRYIESVSRTDGPSLTGRLVSRFRLAALGTQHETWADDRWKLVPGVLDEFSVVEGTPATGRPLRIFVTLGTIRPYEFHSLVDQVLNTGLANEQTVWQLGVTTRTGLPGRAESMIPADEFMKLARDADVVVTHAGVGTILQLLEVGINPVVVPRKSARREHVDDHQEFICKLLRKKQIGIVRDVEELCAADLIRASATSIAAAVSADD